MCMERILKVIWKEKKEFGKGELTGGFALWEGAVLSLWLIHGDLLFYFGSGNESRFLIVFLGPTSLRNCTS